MINDKYISKVNKQGYKPFVKPIFPDTETAEEARKICTDKEEDGPKQECLFDLAATLIELIGQVTKQLATTFGDHFDIRGYYINFPFTQTST